MLFLVGNNTDWINNGNYKVIVFLLEEKIEYYYLNFKNNKISKNRIL